MTGSNFFEDLSVGSSKPPVKVSSRTIRSAIEEALISYTRVNLETVLAEELVLPWTDAGWSPGDRSYSKRDVIQAYTGGWQLPQLIGLARRIVTELDINEAFVGDLADLLAEYDRGGGVESPAKNLIFAANGPKPELVLRDAVNNDIEIVRNGEYCLIYEQLIPADGHTFRHLIDWWRNREHIDDTVTTRDVGLDLHQRLRASLDNPAEHRVFDAYARRYQGDQFDIAVLIPQVYLHYDPSTQYARRAAGQSGSPLARQRMDFLILFSSRHRIVIEVDGKQHYADGDRADPKRYSEMVAEDRRLRLSGYEVYRFGGAELVASGADDMLNDFFAQLSDRMK